MSMVTCAVVYYSKHCITKLHISSICLLHTHLSIPSPLTLLSLGTLWKLRKSQLLQVNQDCLDR